MHLAVGSSDWFKDKERAQDLINGWGDACDLARCVWAGGETPALKGIIVPGASLLSGSSFGIGHKNGPINPKNIKDGDAIIFLESSGIHANGLTLARSIAEDIAKKKDPWWRKMLRHVFTNIPPTEKSLFEAYNTQLPGCRTYGETLLDPTHIYSDFVEDCLDAGVKIHYGVNITGHGWRKLMRAELNFTYTVETLPAKGHIFDFIQEHGNVSDEEMYGNFNMGAGFALYVPKSEVPKVYEVAKRYEKRFHTFEAGHIEAGDKKVVIIPMGLEYAGETLAVR